MEQKLKRVKLGFSHNGLPNFTLFLHIYFQSYVEDQLGYPYHVI